MPIPPDEYSRTGAYELLKAAARGHVAFDRRLIDALTADPAGARPGLIRFAGEDRAADRVDISPDLIYLFTRMPAPEAVPLLIAEMRKEPDDAGHDLIELANRLGAPAADALLDLFEDTLHAHPEILFVALMAGARGPRVDAALMALEATDGDEALFLREIAGQGYEADPAEPGMEYPAEADPDLALLPEKEREEFLLSDVAEFRLGALAYYYNGGEVSDRRRQQLLTIGASDPDPRVRGMAWEVLRDDTDQAPILQAMVARLGAAADPHERACLAGALAYHLEIDGVVEAIEAAYADPVHRAKALEAMWRSLDRRFVDRPVRHLDDSNIEVRRHAVLAVGYFQLRSEAGRLEPLFQDADLREDAIYAYALAAPAAETPFGLRQLEKRIESLAGGLGEDEEPILADALETRLAMAGRARDTTLPAAAVSTKVGRNDPCPCGSGRKHKKCCGAAA